MRTSGTTANLTALQLSWHLDQKLVEKKMKCVLASIFVLIGFMASAFAQATPSNSPTPEQSEMGKRLEEFLKEEDQKKNKSAADQILPDTSAIDTLDEPTKARALAAYREYYDYRISGYQHRREVFKWQLFSSKIIFAVVILLVLVGVYFSGIQFHRSLGRRPAATNRTADDKDAAEKIIVNEEAEVAAGATQIEASLKGIKVSSSILGVIILVISLLFFYLYLVYVYPIHEVL
jgi:hypothetical protein